MGFGRGFLGADGLCLIRIDTLVAHLIIWAQERLLVGGRDNLTKESEDDTFLLSEAAEVLFITTSAERELIVSVDRRLAE